MRIGVAVGVPQMGGAYNPASDPLVYDLLTADDASTITHVGGVASAWRTVKGALSLTASGTPAYTTTTAPRMVFNGTADYFRVESVGSLPTGSASVIMWVLGKNLALPADTTARRAVAYGGSTNAGSRQAMRTVVGGVNRAQSSGGDGVSTTVNATDTVADLSGWHVQRHRLTATLVGVAVNDGAETTAAVTLNTGTTRLTVGANNLTTASNFWHGDVREVIFSQDTAEAIANIAPYLAAKRAAMIAAGL